MNIVLYMRTDAKMPVAKQRKQLNDTTIIASYKEKKSVNLPRLREATAKAVELGVVLVIPYAGILVKNMTFTSILRDTGVQFRCLDDPLITPPTIHIYAALAENTSMEHRSRTRSGIVKAKAAGSVFGSSRPGHWSSTLRPGLAKAQANAAVARSVRAKNVYVSLLPKLRELRAQDRTVFEIAEWLNANGHTTTAGSPFSETSVWRLFKRYIPEYESRRGNHSRRGGVWARFQGETVIYDTVIAEAVRMHAGGLKTDQVASKLNELGYRTSDGSLFNNLVVEWLLKWKAA